MIRPAGLGVCRIDWQPLDSDVHRNPLETLSKGRDGPSGSEVGPRVCVPHKLSGDADAPVPGPHLEQKETGGLSLVLIMWSSGQWVSTGTSHWGHP